MRGKDKEIHYIVTTKLGDFLSRRYTHDRYVDVSVHGTGETKFSLHITHQLKQTARTYSVASIVKARYNRNGKHEFHLISDN